MRIAFYGTAPEIGTSASMAVVMEFLRCFQQMAAEICPEFFEFNTAITFVDYSHKIRNQGEIPDDFDLLVVSLPASDRKFEKIFIKNSLVRKNVIFLFGKYFHNDTDALCAFAKKYRIDMGKVCVIPYNLRFQKAYENHTLSAYLQQKEKSFEDEVFQKELLRTIRALLTYAGKRVGVRIRTA